jgi:ATP dependent DNA ligase domain
VSFDRAVAQATRDWRPMAFGTAEAKRIRNPIAEPLWGGRRALIDVRDSTVGIRDEEGAALEGFDALTVAILEASQAFDLVLDGYLLPAPLRSTVGADEGLGKETLMRPSDVARQLFLGGGAQNKRREKLERDAARELFVRPDEPTAFVAIDLLWLDGESLLRVPLQERKRLLDSALADHELVRRSVAIRPPVEAWYAQWKALGFHEIAVKDANGRYEPGGVSRDWAIAPIPRR